ncbi:MAG TPA: hypothetical protein VEI25_01915 [Paraburkholderia sp.]|nr:hypothetical protein [Paraburkholderia sp.]
MNQRTISISAPLLVAGSAVYFSAYGFGWGYRAFAISYEAVHESLGARNTSDEQIRLAFQLSRRQIIDAVLRYESPAYEGQRFLLSLESASGSTASGAPRPTTGNGEIAPPSGGASPDRPASPDLTPDA